MDHILKCHEIFKTDFVRGQNCHLYDREGKKYVDFESGIWCTALGHNHPRINRTIEMQLKNIAHLGTRYPNALAEDAALDVLNAVGIEDGKCTFLSSGSEAVEFGVQIVRHITGKPLLLTFHNSYLAGYGSAGQKRPDEWYLFDRSACASAASYECLDEIPFEKIGGFIFEPGGSGIGFVKFPPKGLVQEIVRRVKQAGGLVAANEITTGMGRTGKWFGFQHYDIQPDIVCLGKGLGNGYPVSAVAMRAEVARKLEKDGFHYVQSHQNDPMGCSIAREVIAIFREEQWVEKGNAKGEFFLQGLKKIEKKHAVVKEARGRGMELALEFHPWQDFSAATAYCALLEKGFLVGYYPAGNILRFDPALTIEREDITHLLECLDVMLESMN
ncbi:MAG: aspartate aminotransferase family protein [Chloroflexi bacterium]|nr:MAG: aspartate aminotransferase family protein [Chloroflexota bacterium]